MPYGDAEALAEALDETVAAVVIEPIQGENGVVVPPADFLRAARDLTRRVGALLWLDEVQTGIGRTGEWLARLPSGITADLITVAKGLGGGFPVGACIATGGGRGRARSGLPRHHLRRKSSGGAGGAGGVWTTSTTTTCWRTSTVGDHLVRGIERLGHPLVAGAWRGPAARHRPGGADRPAVAEAALAAGFVINAPRPAVLRLAPPLVIEADDLDSFVDALPGPLESAR